MIVFISDLHLTDGTSGKTIDTGAFKLFRDRLADLAYDCSWRLRSDGKAVYEPIEQFDLVLLGDVLDTIRSTKWLATKTRPWDNWNTKAFTEKVSEITDAILLKNKDSLEVLRSIQEPDVFTVPGATRTKYPKKVSRDPDAPGRVPVKVRVHYMVGNHDWFFHLPGSAYDAIRAKIINAMG
jgi:UDP-2,3-diacylglucosamine pyrophosphatase LpxH